MASIIDRECVVCRQVVALGDAYYYNFTTGQYRHRSCGLDQEGPRDIGRERLVTPAHTPTPWRPGDGHSILATWPDGTEVQIAAMFHTTWSGDDGGKTRRIQAETPGNLALIIRAVNNHADLLEALEALTVLLARDYVVDSLRQEPRGISPAGEAAVLAARAAIARATGG